MPATQVTFTRINPVAPVHALADDEVQTATNVDFGMGQGALVPRRGCSVFGTVAAGSNIWLLHRNYNNADDISAGKFYAHDSAGNVYKGSGNTWSVVSTGGASGFPAFANYQQYTLIASGANKLKDDGTNTTQWIKQSPGAPTITVSTLAPLDLFMSTATFAVTEGTPVSGTTTITADVSANNRVTLTISYAGATDLTTNAGQALGDFAVHFVDLAFDNPNLVTKISQDYSVGDADFYNYWHAELSPQSALVESGQADPASLVDAQAALGTSTDALSIEDRERMISAIRDNNRSSAAVLTRISDTYAPWAVSRPDFRFVGSDPNAGGTSPWSNVYAVRYTFECSGTVQVRARDPQVGGATTYPLTDIDVGYAWWQTYATLDSDGRKIGESAPGPSSSRTRMQNARALVTLTGTATGTVHGVTHVITYRQGGFTRDAYAVSTATYTGVSTLTDTMNDLQALSLNYQMPRNIHSYTTFSPTIISISQPWNDRVFTGQDNYVQWSLPGLMDSFSKSSYVQVGHKGDHVRALVVWDPGVVIVNQYSVYELRGNDFDSGDYTLTRSGAKHGSIPPRVPIATPYGIPLLNYDGLSMYVPGQGEVEISWLMDQYGDIFRGANSSDPAARKGSRCPAINRGYILYCCSAYAENKLYLAAPTGSSTTNNTLFVIDFARKSVWWYTYSFSISSLFWDHQDSRLFAGTPDGRVMLLERGETDVNTGGTATSITWSAKTKAWSANTDSVLENVSVDLEGGPVVLKGYYDPGYNPTLSTLTATNRAWVAPPLDGSYARNIQFEFYGTSTSTAVQNVYQLTFEYMPEPVRGRYLKTPHEDLGTPNQKLWDVANYDIEALGSGSVLAVTFVDNTAVMTHTVTAPTSGRVLQARSFPAGVYGKIAYTTFTASSTDVLFKHWNDTKPFEGRPEPPQVNSWRTDLQSLDEAICDAFDSDLNPAGTVFGTVYVDNTAVTTGTFVGTSQQSYTTTIPVETYGRTLYVQYTGTAFKHYNTWYHRRDEPDRWTSYVSDKRSGDEHEWKVFKPELALYGTGTCTATVFVEGTAVSTHTALGPALRRQYTLSLPYATFGRTIWAQYSCTAGVTLKHYSTDFDGVPEPPRVTTFRYGPKPLPSKSHIKTWVPELDPRGSTVTGTLYVDGTAVATNTFSGGSRQNFFQGVDIDVSNNIRTGSVWEVRYSNPSVEFKHYNTELEVETFPYRKQTWSYHYRKLGGASQVDLLRFWALDYDSDVLSTATYWWDVNGTNFTTGTLTLTAGNGFRDRIPVPNGGRGQIFEFRLRADQPISVNSVNADMLQEGIKALTRRSVQGNPND